MVYGKFNTGKNPPSRERYRPPESQQYKNVDKSATKLVYFTKKYIGKKNIKTSHLETSPDEGMDFGKLSVLWEKLAVCESKLEMMGRMIEKRVGFNEIEDFVNKLEKKKVEIDGKGGKSSKNQKLIELTMTIKLRDERRQDLSRVVPS